MIAIKYYLIWISFVLVLSFNLLACSTRGTAIPQDGPSMEEIYQDAMQPSAVNPLDLFRQELAKKHPHKINDLKSYTSTANKEKENEIEPLFSLLANPSIPLYVYPHLAGQEPLAIPGYTTAFTLYDKIYYAMPGEITN